MDPAGNLGRTLILVGLAIVALGIVLTLAGRLPWLGRLPGDFSWESERVKVYFPFATSLLLSAVLTLLLYLFRR